MDTLMRRPAWPSRSSAKLTNSRKAGPTEIVRGDPPTLKNKKTIVKKANRPYEATHVRMCFPTPFKIHNDRQDCVPIRCLKEILLPISGRNL